MKENLSEKVRRMRATMPEVSSQNSSTTINTPPLALGKANCPYCHGVGLVRWDVPMGHEKFGKVELCACRASEAAQLAKNRLYALSQLNRLSHLTFENFRAEGNPKARGTVSTMERTALLSALEVCRSFAEELRGWVLLEGSYGSGKTHLAAAIGNAAVTRGVPTLFITAPDLLDSLRFAYNNPETTFEGRFDEIKNAPLLVMDDFGTQNATGWAQEKLFQIVNYRYINQLPTVVTTNLALDEIEGRIRSRLQDESLVKHVRLFTPDYRRPEQTSNPGLSMLNMSDIKAMTFGTWNTREQELGQEVATITRVERKNAAGFTEKSREIVRETVSAEHIKRLEQAHNAAAAFAEHPRGWLVLLGPSYSGKTHLAAAVGNYRMGNGGQAVMADVAALLDYLRQTFRPSMDVSFDRRFYEIREASLLILDGLKESNFATAWAEDKLFQLLNFRFYENLPTVITSTMTPDDFGLNYPALWNRLLDSEKCQRFVMDMPPYRKVKAKGGRKKS